MAQSICTPAFRLVSRVGLAKSTPSQSRSALAVVEKTGPRAKDSVLQRGTRADEQMMRPLVLGRLAYGLAGTIAGCAGIAQQMHR